LLEKTTLQHIVIHDEQEGMWVVATVAYFKAPTHHLQAENKENLNFRKAAH
jgi:hypothetical protein